MKLPLDNFQILGANPGSNVHNILMALERKLERCEYSGFSEKTLSHRNYLLRHYSKPLLDHEERQRFEQKYLFSNLEDGEKHILDIPSGLEVGGLLLLLESRLFDDCLTLATSLIDKNYDSYSKTHEDMTDLYLLVGYATLEYARELRSKRYYDYCARILEKGLLRIRDKPKLDEIKSQIQAEVEEIIPFRILDLLSRDMEDKARKDGIELLRDFVIKRGGLDNQSRVYMEDAEFKSFFRQIRYYLTVQEQVDFYKDLCISNSETACFLLAITLVASGFARRKPEHLVQALELMNKLRSEELSAMIGYISLLLGKIEHIRTKSKDSEEIIKDRPERSSEVSLGDLCTKCRDWLESDVLEGYRDLEAEADLEAYFSDRDVTNFIEKSDLTMETTKDFPSRMFGSSDGYNNIFNRSSLRKSYKVNDISSNMEELLEPSRSYSRKNDKGRINPIKWSFGIGIIVISLLILFTIVKKNIVKTSQVTKAEGKTIIFSKKTRPLGSNQDSPVLLEESLKIGKKIPSESMISSILSEWLNIKAIVLSGQKIPASVHQVATKEAITRLEAERKEDKSKGEVQEISAQVKSVKKINSEINRIEVDVALSYADKRLDPQKNVIELTPRHEFNKRYILVNRDSKWLID